MGYVENAEAVIYLAVLPLRQTQDCGPKSAMADVEDEKVRINY